MDISNFIVNYRDSTEIPKLGYTAGLNIALTINKHISLETGFLYSDKGEKTKKNDLIWGQPDPGLPTKNTFIYHYIYLDIPIKVNYFILRKRIKFHYSAGISPSIFLTDKTTSILEYNDGHTTEKTTANSFAYSKINLVFITGFGMSYDLAKKLYFKIEPIYRRSLTSIIDAPIKGYLYSFGINSGLYYKL